MPEERIWEGVHHGVMLKVVYYIPEVNEFELQSQTHVQFQF